MRIRLLELRNYRRHRHTRIELPDGLTTILGRNGSGKSTLLEAVGFALFGVPATRTAKDLIRWDEAPPGDGVSVVLEAELAGQAVRIVRELRGKNLTPSASLEVDGTVQVAPGASSNQAVTDAVERLLGMPRDAFFTTVVARQRELSRLADQRPADRKRLILDMLGVDAIDTAIVEARRRANDAQVRVDAIREGLPQEDTLTQALEEAELTRRRSRAAHAQAHERREACEAAVKVAEAEAQAKREVAQRRRSDAERTKALVEQLKQTDEALAAARQRLQQAMQASDEAERLRPQAETLPALRARLEAARLAHRDRAQRKSLEEKLEALHGRRSDIGAPQAPNGGLERARAELKASQGTLRALEAQAAEARADARHAKDRLRRLAGLAGNATCPTCERPLEDHVDGLREHYEQEHAAKDGRLRRLLVEVQAAEARVDEAVRIEAETTTQAEAARRATEETARLDDEIAQLQHQIASLDVPAEAPDVDRLAAQVSEAEQAERQHATALARAEARGDSHAEVARLEERRAGLVQKTETADQLQAEADVAAEEARIAEAGLAQARTDLDGALRTEHTQASDLRVAEQAVGEARRRLDELKQARVRLDQAKADARLWKALVAGRGKGLLERFRTHIVSRIGPAVSAEASRLLARFTGGRYDELVLDDDYQIYVTDGGTRYTLDRFSGGEADVAHLALRLAVSRLLNERSGGAEMRFLALDEVFGSLDAERRDLVLAALQELGGLYSQVLLVTHQESLRDALDRAIMVTEEDGEAVVTMHNG